MTRFPRWLAALMVLVCMAMIVVAVLLLIAVVRLGVPTDILGEITQATGTLWPSGV
ncbi:MAG TPA: hypothetical protein VK046_01475 [Actinomycetaceae bacterium]|nr:hypothetical protein [Actinomycetaceae bacterium]